MREGRQGGSRVRMVARLLRGGIAALALSLAGGFVVFVQSLDRAETAPRRHAEGIVALTGGAERVTDGLALLAQGDGDRLLTSGVNRTTSAEDLARDAPEARRLFACCVELGYAAENTVGNARETRAWVRRHHVHSLIVVTSNYHMPRALAEIADAAPGVELLPYPVVSERAEGGNWWSDAGRLRLVLVEYLKYLVVLARTHLHPAAPYANGAASLGRPLLTQGEPCWCSAPSSSTSCSTSS